jgi:lysophospholipase L1-like esterase
MEMIKKFFHGYQEIVEQNGYLQPLRFNNKEIEYYTDLSIKFGIRAHSTAGITLQFYTDEKEISFDCKIENFIREHDSITVYENDTFAKSFQYSKESPLQHLSYLKKDNERAKIVIYFPALSSLAIKNFDTRQKIPISNFPTTLLCYGDSITKGVEANNSSESYTNKIARAMNYEIRNLAVGGHYFDPNSLLNKGFDDQTAFLIGYGTNDFSRHEIHDIENHIICYLRDIRELHSTAKIYCISPIWRFDLNETNIGKMNKIRNRIEIEIEAIKNGMIYIDGFNLLDKDKSLYADAKVHPNDLGFTIMANKIIEVMSQ